MGVTTGAGLSSFLLLGMQKARASADGTNLSPITVKMEGKDVKIGDVLGPKVRDD